MILADNRNICEEIEITIYSDTELTQEQLNHIENCESCRALLSQIKELKNDLVNLNISGIGDGRIADAVMEEINKEKLSVPFPKFKFTHHLGTAAAVVIILVAALMIKNPTTDTVEKAVVDNTANNSAVKEAYDTAPEEQHFILATHEEPAVKEEADTETEEDAPMSAEEEQPDEPKFRALEYTPEQSTSQETTAGTSVLPTVSDKENSYLYDDGAINTTADTNVITAAYYKTANYGYQQSEEAPSNEVTEEVTPESGILNTVIDSVALEEAPVSYSDIKPEESAINAEGTQAVTYDLYAKNNDFSDGMDNISVEEHPVSGGGSAGGAGGGGGGSSANGFIQESAPVENEKQDGSSKESEENTEIQTQNIFEGITFLSGEENYDYNIALANSRLFELYGGKHMLTKELLASYGCTNNREFLTFIVSYSVS